MFTSRSPGPPNFLSSAAYEQQAWQRRNFGTAAGFIADRVFILMRQVDFLSHTVIALVLTLTVNALEIGVIISDCDRNFRPIYL
jgi:hypothetical protein